jgi:hypothetical protein
MMTRPLAVGDSPQAAAPLFLDINDQLGLRQPCLQARVLFAHLGELLGEWVKWR